MTIPAASFKPWYIGRGDRIGEYIVCTAIGEGSGGIVYEVEDAAGRHLALKLSRSPLAATGSDSVLCERFHTSLMAHIAVRELENVVHLLSFGFLEKPEGAFPYLVMELVPGGETITAWARHRSP